MTRSADFETEGARGFFAPSKTASTELLVVTFNELGFTNRSDDFWGRSVFETLNQDCLGIVSKERRWFSGILDEIAHASLPIRSRYKYVIGYGFSMGAFAALKGSGLLGFDAVLALSPQMSIDPAIVETFDRRYAWNFRTEDAGWQLHEGDVRCPSWLLYDPAYDIDRRHAEEIAKRANTTLVPVWFAGHDTAPVMRGSATMRRLLTAVQARDTAAITALAREKARANSDRHYLAAKALAARGKPKSALAAARIACNRRPDEAGRLLFLGGLLERSGDFEEALRNTKAAIKVAGNVDWMLYQASRVAAGAGKWHEALDYIGQALAAKPGNPSYIHYQAHLEKRIAQIESAA